MVRVLFIRHTETVANVRMQGRSYVSKKRLMTKGQLLHYDQLRSQQRDSSTPPLMSALELVGEEDVTGTGVDMADAMAEYWAPVLAPFLERGKLEFVVSPSYRTLVTLDPLVRRLQAMLGTEHKVTGLLRPDLCEIPSPQHADDDTVKGQIKRLLELSRELKAKARESTTGAEAELKTLEREARSYEAEARLLLLDKDSRGWTPAGLTGGVIVERFPWVVIPEG